MGRNVINDRLSGWRLTLYEMLHPMSGYWRDPERKGTSREHFRGDDKDGEDVRQLTRRERFFRPTDARHWANALMADGTEIVVAVKHVRGYMSHGRAFDIAEEIASRLESYEAVVEGGEGD